MHFLVEQQLPTGATWIRVFKGHSFESPPLASCAVWVITKPEDWACSWVVPNPACNTQAFSDRHFPVVACRLWGLFVWWNSHVNTLLWALGRLIINPLMFPQLPAQPKMSFLVSCLGLFVPLGFFPSKFSKSDSASWLCRRTVIRGSGGCKALTIQS